MKKSILLLATIAVLASTFPFATNAATQVYDLKADWSNTQNPNGPWSYRQGDGLLINDPLPWVGAGYDGCPVACHWPPVVPALEKVAGNVQVYGGRIYVSEGYLQDGDVLFLPGLGGNILWTAAASGTIDIAGATWALDPEFLCFEEPFSVTSWTLTRDGSVLSGGDVAFPLCGSNPRGSPHDFSLGSGGAAALQNISVAAGDQIVLAFSTVWEVGINLTITLTPDSVDPVGAIEALAETVVAMNLQNGIENSLDSKLDAAVNALIDANFNNDGAACNSLAAFISAVEAQRGKKITSAQADQLIAAAQAIRDLLNCSN